MADGRRLIPGNRLRRAQSEWSHNRSTGTMRNDFRCSFLNRLRKNRSRSVDRFRLLVGTYGQRINYGSVSDLRTVLAEDPEASKLMKDTDVNEVLNQIEKELAHVVLEDQGDNHLKETEGETHDILKRHLKICILCDNPNPECETICKVCADTFVLDCDN